MPHIDDGTLHAYLDGALDAVAAAGGLPDGLQPRDVVEHLESCDDCRSRLERERGIRERAGLVLRAGAPAALPVPPLRDAALPARRRRYIPLAWAASLLLAVGAGWWGSRVAREAAAPAGSVADRPADAARPESVQQRALSTSPTPGEPAGQAPGAPAASAAAAGPTAADAVQPEPVIAAAERTADQRAEPIVLQIPERPALEVASLPATVQTFSVTARPEVSTPPTRSGRDMVSLFLLRDSAGGVQWRSAAERGAQLRPGEAIGLVDAEVVAIDVAPELGMRVVRVRQRLGTGEELEVMSWHAEVIALSELVVTGEPRPAAPAVARRAEQRAREGAQVSPSAKPAETATLRSPPTLRTANTHEITFAGGTSGGTIVVRAPVWLSPQDALARLGVVAAPVSP